MCAQTRISVPLTQDELTRLLEVSHEELRHPREQARYLLRVGLGLVAGTDAAPVTPTAGGSRAPAAAEAAVAA